MEIRNAKLQISSDGGTAGKNSKTYKITSDYMEFMEERCVPRIRAIIREILEVLGLIEYDPIEIIAKTEGRMAEDNQWLVEEDVHELS